MLCTGGMSNVEARVQWQYSTAIDFLHEDKSATYHLEVSWGLGGIYFNIISCVITLSIYKRNCICIIPVGYLQALFWRG